MPRIARKFYEGKSFYHIMVQGIEKKFIFNKSSYKKKYVQLMKYYFGQSNISLIAYCVMDNHVHILLNIKNIEELSKTMQKINAVYAMYYNKEENRVGYVYRERFKSQEIQDVKHLYRCINYIHQNPIKAKIVKNPKEYLYSSYNDYIYEKGIFNLAIKNLLYKNGISYEIFSNTDLQEKYYGEFIDDEENVDVFNEALIENDFNLIEILQEKDKMNIIILYLKDNKNVSLREIASKFGIARETIRRMVKSSQEGRSILTTKR